MGSVSLIHPDIVRDLKILFRMGDPRALTEKQTEGPPCRYGPTQPQRRWMRLLRRSAHLSSLPCTGLAKNGTWGNASRTCGLHLAGLTLIYART